MSDNSIPPPTPFDLERDAAADYRLIHEIAWSASHLEDMTKSWIRRWNAERQRAETAIQLGGEDCRERARAEAEREAERQRADANAEKAQEWWGRCESERQARLAAEAAQHEAEADRDVQELRAVRAEAERDRLQHLLGGGMACCDLMRAALEAQEALEDHNCGYCRDIARWQCAEQPKLRAEARRLRREALGREEGGQAG